LFHKGNQLQNSQTIGEIGIKRKGILSLLDLRDKIDAANKYFNKKLNIKQIYFNLLI
jgi:hypothetical protein